MINSRIQSEEFSAQVAGFLAALVIASVCAQAAAGEQIIDPLKLNANTLRRLEENKKTQQQKVAKSTVFHGFKFQDRFEASGITFRHKAVDDAAKNWKPAHYDHGSGMAVADVDGDARLDIYFVNQLGANALFRNLGGGRFADITTQAGVAMEGKISVAAAFGDIDNDGRPDLFVTTARMGNQLFRNAGGGKFEDVTAAAGVGHVGHSSGAVFFDFDRDGLLDLFVTNVGKYTQEERGAGGFYLAYEDAFKAHLEPRRYEQSILYRNLGGGKFRDVSKEMNLLHSAWSGEAVACDVNEDGFADLYVPSMQGDDKYYENQGGKSFVEKTAQIFPKTPWGAMGVKFFDFNLDGRFDLYVTDMHSDMTGVQTTAGKRDLSEKFEKVKSEAWCSMEWTDEFLQGASNNIFGNGFYVRQADGEFMEMSDRTGTETYWPWGPSVGDVNADGYEDIFVTAGMGYPFRYGINSLLLNERGRRFVDAEFVLGVEPRRNGVDIEYFTLDCSGADKEHSLCRHKKGLVKVLGSTSSRSSVIFDLDDDGDLDLMTNEMNDRPQVFISDLAARKKINFLKVRLVGTKSNRDGLGAKVSVFGGGQGWHRMNDGKSGYLGQSSAPLYFAFGDVSRIDRLEVAWPSGKKQEITSGLELNRLLEITEPRE
jgi:enediyne biosynthesis protein E4